MQKIGGPAICSRRIMVHFVKDGRTHVRKYAHTTWHHRNGVKKMAELSQTVCLQSTNEEVSCHGRTTNGRKDGWTDGWMNEWMDGWLDGWIDEWMDGWLDGWIDEWMDGRMNGWMDG